MSGFILIRKKNNLTAKFRSTISVESQSTFSVRYCGNLKIFLTSHIIVTTLWKERD